MLPLVINKRAIGSPVPLAVTRHVADVVVVLVADVAVRENNRLALGNPPLVMGLHTNRKRTGFPVLAKNFRLGVVSGHVISSS
jgi:hypothetical protein